MKFIGLPILWMMPENELDVAKILRAPTCTLVGKERGSADHGHRDIPDLNMSSILPSFLKSNAVDRRDHVDPPRNDAYLEDEIVTREVIDFDLFERPTELRQGLIDKTRIREIVRDPDIKITGGPWLRMNCQRVGADKQKPNSAADEFA
jgi:hypothetical protein